MLLATDSNKTYHPVHPRWMIRRDMDEVMDIEDESFEYPWNTDDFIKSLRQRNCTGMVAADDADDNKVLGFIVYKLEYRDIIRLLNLAVSPEYWRRGIGTQMMDKLKSKLSPVRKSRICLEVSERNLRAQLFFRSQGFRAVCPLRGYYPDTPEDSAYFMQYTHRPPLIKPAESQGYLSKLKAYFSRTTA